MIPGYLKLAQNGELTRKSKALDKLLDPCILCPRRCRANRNSGHAGICNTAEKAIVASYTAHHGEEPPISGTRGSGAIFFSRCNLECIFCQNWQISQQGIGEPVTDRQLADMMIELQERGCHNINWVSPTHVAAQAVRALVLAVEDGLEIPIVWNSNGYDSVDTLKLMDGIVDIYLPDAKYTDSADSMELSGVPDYKDVNRAALLEMFRQAGQLQFDSHGIALRGVLVRHLVLPHGRSGTSKVMEFIAGKLGTDTWISLMSQYHPCHRAESVKGMNRGITVSEYEKARRVMENCGFTNYYAQEMTSEDNYLPDFEKESPFEA